MHFFALTRAEARMLAALLTLAAAALLLAGSL
jgi:hypothetical protein